MIFLTIVSKVLKCENSFKQLISHHRTFSGIEVQHGMTYKGSVRRLSVGRSLHQTLANLKNEKLIFRQNVSIYDNFNGRFAIFSSDFLNLFEFFRANLKITIGICGVREPEASEDSEFN